MKDEKEDRNRKIGMAVSIGIHAVLALLFIFIMAWREPNPPLPEYGVVLNFGMDEAGSGDIQPEAQPTEETETEETEEAQPAESEESTEELTEPVEEVVEETATTTQESPVTVPEVKEEKKVTKPKEEKKTEPEKKPAEEKPVEKKQEERKVESAYPAKDPSKTQSQGDKTGTGDQGNPEGELNADALYGNQGGGGGSSFSLEGWNWDNIPKPEDQSNENGILKFEIKVNADGEILNVRTIERSVSPAVEKIYRAEVEKLTFSRKSSSGNAPPVSVGTITFVIKSK